MGDINESEILPFVAQPPPALTIATQPYDDQPASVLLQLPAELRNIIYEGLLKKDQRLVVSFDAPEVPRDPGGSITTAPRINKLVGCHDLSLVILYTCRKAYREAVIIFYKKNIFELRKSDTHRYPRLFMEAPG